MPLFRCIDSFFLQRLLLTFAAVLAFGLSTDQAECQSQTKQRQQTAQDGSQTKNAEGSSTRNSEGSDSKNQEGSGTTRRGNRDNSNVESSDVNVYRAPQPTQVDPQLLDQALESAAEIDRLVEAKLKEQGQSPNPLTKDLPFVRRAYLDIVGTIPTGRQAVAFDRQRSSRGKNKHSQLIDTLLNSQGHVSHSFNFWAEILRLVDRERGGNLRPYSDWVKDSIAADIPYDQFVTEMLSSEGRVWENPPVGYTLRDLDMTKANLDNSMRIFLGTRIGCAQCHDHPFDHWTQKQFYELAAFVHGTAMNYNRHLIDEAVRDAQKQVRAMTPKSKERMDMENQVNRMVRFNRVQVGEKTKRKLRLPDDYQYDNGRPGEKIDPKVTFGQPPKIKRGEKLRKTFADWVTSTDNPRFTLTIANRLWERVFGVGVIEPVDNLTDASEASNDELMDFLVSEMKRVNYSQREFLRILYNTKTYQRECFTEDRNPTEPYHFPGPLMRRMTAQQIWDSMLTLTLAEPDLYQRPRGDVELKLAAINLGDQLNLEQIMQKQQAARQVRGRDGEEAKLRKMHSHQGYLMVRASEMPQPQRPDHFLRQFGQSDRTLISGGSVDGHVPQILTMFNGPISHKLLYEGTVIYDEVAMAPSMKDKVEVIFLSILTRGPSRTDKKIALAEMNAEGPAGVGNLIWSLLNTREFIFIQ